MIERDGERETQRETERDGGREGGRRKRLQHLIPKKNVSFAFIYKIMHFLCFKRDGF